MVSSCSCPTASSGMPARRTSSQPAPPKGWLIVIPLDLPSNNPLGAWMFPSTHPQAHGPQNMRRWPRNVPLFVAVSSPGTVSSPGVPCGVPSVQPERLGLGVFSHAEVSIFRQKNPPTPLHTRRTWRCGVEPKPLKACEPERHVPTFHSNPVTNLMHQNDTFHVFDRDPGSHVLQSKAKYFVSQKTRRSKICCNGRIWALTDATPLPLSA